MKPFIIYKFSKLRTKILKLLSYYLAFYLITSLLLFVFEHKPDRDETGALIYRNGQLVYSTRCKTVLDAFWINIVYFFTGFEDYGPRTLPGKIISFLSFFVGIATITAITGKIASHFVLKALKERKMDKDLNGHIAICNWNIGGEKIIREIHDPEAEPDVEIIVISQTAVNEEELRHRPEFEKVFFLRCDPSLHTGLKASRISGAKSVIILADPSVPDPDAVTAMIALAITRICNKETRPHIIAQAVNHRKTDHLIDAGVDEIICASDFEYGLIAQCSILGKFGKLSQIYQQLLVQYEDSNEFYIVPPADVPNILIGKSYNDACILFSQKRNTKNPVILVGLVRKGKVMLNPRNNVNSNRKSQAEHIHENDGLVIIAWEKPDLKKLLAES